MGPPFSCIPQPRSPPACPGKRGARLPSRAPLPGILKEKLWEQRAKPPSPAEPVGGCAVLQPRPSPRPTQQGLDVPRARRQTDGQ